MFSILKYFMNLLLTQAKCSFCLKEFAPKRSTARFCSDKCRVYSARGSRVSVTATVTDSVTSKHLSVTKRPPHRYTGTTEGGWKMNKDEQRIVYILNPFTGKHEMYAD